MRVMCTCSPRVFGRGRRGVPRGVVPPAVGWGDCGLGGHDGRKACLENTYRNTSLNLNNAFKREIRRLNRQYVKLI